MLRVDVDHGRFVWARERAGLDPSELSRKFKDLPAWESGAKRPTVKQLRAYADATYAPFGAFFGPPPSADVVPIPDLRTVGDRPLHRPSPNLLDTIADCERRQDWFRDDYARASGLEPVAFVGSATLADDPRRVADVVRTTLGLSLEARRSCPTWTDALRQALRSAEDAGVLVMCNGVVAGNTRRKLDPEEFRGFALSDPLAPLIFVNGADTKAAQMFTLVHEAAHLWLGATALSDVPTAAESQQPIERWCNRVAAEVLVPEAALRAEVGPDPAAPDETRRLARVFKVSGLVVLRRLREIGALDAAEFDAAFRAEQERAARRPPSNGGSFYLSQIARVGRRFARALFESTLEGNTLYRDAYRLLGVRKTATFAELGRRLGFAV